MAIARIVAHDKQFEDVEAKLSELEDQIDDKVVKLAENGDHVNDIQRQVLESLDERLTSIELLDKESLKSYDSVATRMLNNEIKTEKLLSGA